MHAAQDNNMTSSLDQYLYINSAADRDNVHTDKIQKHRGMEFEALRLASFDKWPHWAPKRPSDLASNGFYYSGKEDCVVCFSCGVRISKWRAEDSVVDKHKQASLRCKLVNGKALNNVPLLCEKENGAESKHETVPVINKSSVSGVVQNCDVEENSSERKTDRTRFGSSQTTETRTMATSSKEVKSTNVSVIASSSVQNPDLVQVGNVGTIREVDDLLEYMRSLGTATEGQRGMEAEIQDTSDNAQLGTPDLQLANTASNRMVTEPGSPLQELGTGPIEKPDENFLNHEMYRLRTFTGKWSDDYYVSPTDLAKAGFFYVGTPDRVQCAFCKGRLLNWSPTDAPMSEHSRCFPTCPFVRGENVGNVTIEESMRGSVQFPKKTEKSPSHSDQLGIVTGHAKHPGYALEFSRLESFKTWPKSQVIAPEILAAAGFFYNGYSDNVKCFYCDGGLRNWEREDEPWREHARWFARCGFLKLQKGEKFVEDVLKETEPIGNCLSHTNQEPLNADISRSLDTPMIRAVVNMGYPVQLVRQVIESQRTMTGRDFSEASELFEAVTTASHNDNPTRGRQAGSRQEPNQQATGNQPASPATHRETPKAKSSPKRKTKAESAASQDINESTPREKSLEDIDVNAHPEVKDLLREYQRIRDERMCKICMDEDCTVVFLPCGHLVCCGNCAPALRHCPICRNVIKGSVRVYNT